MKKITLLCLAGLVPVFLFAQTSSAPKRLDEGLSYLHRIHQFNGTALYAENGKVVYKKALAWRIIPAREPLQTSSAFNLASVSKQFFAMGILILSEQRKLHLDDPMHQYLPELNYPGVTIRHLLTRAPSGLSEYFEVFRNKETLDTLTNEGLIQLYNRVKPAALFAPGERREYCNTNYVLLSTIIERVLRFIRQ